MEATKSIPVLMPRKLIAWPQRQMRSPIPDSQEQFPKTAAAAAALPLPPVSDPADPGSEDAPAAAALKARRDGGFALLIVLWAMAFLAFLTSQILTTGRAANDLAWDLRTVAEARATADGAINEALFHVVSTGANHWPPDGSPHNVDDAVVSVQSLASKINPNLASTALLAGLLQALGASSAQAQQLAIAIIQWRSQAATKQDAATRLAAYRLAGLQYAPLGRPFADLGELSDVIGMPPLLLAKAMPEMSLYQSDDPDPALADLVVRRALTLSGQTGSNSRVYEGTVPVVSIEAKAFAGGVVVRRKAIIGIAGNDAPEPFHLILLIDD